MARYQNLDSLDVKIGEAQMFRCCRNEKGGISQDLEVDWTSVPDDVVELALEQADKYLKAQLDVSLAADRRALSIAQMFLGLFSAMAAVVVTYLSKAAHPDVDLLYAAGSFQITMACAVFIGFWAGRPVTFYFPGNWPSSIRELEAKSKIIVKRSECAHYQRYIRSNHEVMGRNAKDLNAANILGVLSPVVAGIVFFL